MFRDNYYLYFFLFIACTTIVSKNISISQKMAQQIGQKIWLNECAGSINGLTTWNKGENFASLGIGHFIWYPAGKKMVFKESFPSLIFYMRQHGQKIPKWIEMACKSGCPWKNRDEFLKESQSPKMKELRTFLASTINLQTSFMVQRFHKTLPRLMQAADEDKKNHVRNQFLRIAQSPGGIYPLIDYVNFKGEGIKTTEAYNNVRWGLLQVLEEMVGNNLGKEAIKEFSTAALKVLQNRVANAPMANNEQRWLPGWTNRIKTYTKFD